MKTSDPEKQFIPSYLFVFAVTAVVVPYLSILIRSLGYTPARVGMLLGVFELAGIAGPFLFGFFVDRTGRYRASLVVSCCFPVLAVFPLITWIHPAISAVFLAMLAVSVRSSLSMLDAITTIKIGKSGNYGRIRVWGSIGFILASLCLQWTPFNKPNTAASISLWIVIFSVISIAPILLLPRAMLKPDIPKDTLPDNMAEEAETSVAKTIPLISVYALGGFGIIFLSRIAMSVVYTYFPLYVTEVLQWDMLGLLFALATASEVPVIFISSKLIRRFGPIPMMAVSAVGVCLRLLIWAFLPYKSFIVFSQLLHSLCYGIFHPAAVYFIAGIFSAKNRGTGMSMYMAIGIGLPSLIGNMAGGVIVEAAGYKTLFVLYAALAGAAALLGGVMRGVKRIAT